MAYDYDHTDATNLNIIAYHVAAVADQNQAADISAFVIAERMMIPQNWGMLDGRPVCHDYGVTISNFSMKKTRKAIWTEQEAPARA